MKSFTIIAALITTACVAIQHKIAVDTFNTAREHPSAFSHQNKAEMTTLQAVKTAYSLETSHSPLSFPVKTTFSKASATLSRYEVPCTWAADRPCSHA